MSCGGATTPAIAGALPVVDGRLLQLGIEKEGVLGATVRVTGEVPAPAVAALANSFFADHAGAAAGALARCATLFAVLPLPADPPKSASNSSSGASRPA